MPANDKILVTDYNSIRNKVVGVLGTGSGSSGYGQVVSSSAVSLSSRITVNEYAALRNDIINAYRHIFGVTPNLNQPVEGNTVRFIPIGTITTEFGVAEFGESEFNLETLADADSPFPQYAFIADDIVANRFTIHPSRSKTESKGSQSRSDWTGGFWNNRLSCTITVSFTTATQARYFFNSGGQIRFESSRSGGNTSRSQNISWSSLLSAAGVQRFGGQLPTTGFSPMNGQNFYRLTNSYQTWYTISASSPYTNNVYRIQARSNVTNNSSGTASSVDFLVEWIDGYVDPGPPSLKPSPASRRRSRRNNQKFQSRPLEATGVFASCHCRKLHSRITLQYAIGTIIQDANGPL
jgi:hypothetical protein